MESALIVTNRNAAALTELLRSFFIVHTVVLPSCGEARRYLPENPVDLVLVNAPLPDETGEAFARCAASKSEAQVILAVKQASYEAAAAACESDGVLTLPKPLSRILFRTAFSLARSAHGRFNRMKTENDRLKQKIADIHLINRAKLILITYIKMSEKEAHRYIEKQAMDLRVTRRAVAEGILKTYEN